MKAKKVTPAKLKAVLVKLADSASRDKSFAKQICFELNIFLDDLLNNDFFGTEGQLDPRGDHRD